MEIVRTVMIRALKGERGHVNTERGLLGLSWQLAGKRAEGMPHTIFRLVQHMNYWQEYCLELIEGGNPPFPSRAADSWPGTDEPAGRLEWEETVNRFTKGLARAIQLAESCDFAQRIAARPESTILDYLQSIASHNSYHLGQVALIRRILGAWPPPGGGDTW
jgi:uncharacterized damage-inducible protein DinB